MRTIAAEQVRKLNPFVCCKNEKIRFRFINSCAPYAVKEDTQEGAYTFIADSGAEFSIGFMPDDLIQSDESYEFIIGNLNGVKSPRDKKVKATVIAIVEEFFNANKATMLFLCSTSDGKQLMRGRLFKNWFDTYKYRNRFTMVTSTLLDEYGILLHVMLSMRYNTNK